MREVAAQFERPVLLFSGGKDSLLMVHLAVKAFAPARIPFPLVHIDTGHNFPETIEFRDELESLADESARACGAEYAVPVRGDEAVAKIVQTTRKLGWVRGGAKALAWRNGAIAQFGRRHRIPTPVTDRLLKAVGYDPGPSHERG